jgi:hypothetical protein
MPWASPFRKKIKLVLELTEPPPDVTLDAGVEALAVGLLMRARMLLRAHALLADRMLGGTADSLLRSILEAVFTGAWLLTEPSAYDVFLGHHRKRWRVIAGDQLGRQAPVNPAVRAELEMFLDRSNSEMPPEADVPSFQTQAQLGGFGNFYQVYRMVSRRAHPDLAAARTGLIEDPIGQGFRVNASAVSVELSNVYIEAGTYLVARLGAMVANRLEWDTTARLDGLVQRMNDEAERAFAAARAEFGTADEEPTSSGSLDTPQP